MTTLTEADVEAAALAWLADVGWRAARGPGIAPDAPGAERDGYGQVALERRLRGALVRRNTVVIADEAHRSRYDFVDGFARHMRDALPNASFVGFTGTPIELEDASTVVQARSFAGMPEQTLRRYRNRAIEAAQVVEELMPLAR